MSKLKSDKIGNEDMIVYLDGYDRTGKSSLESELEISDISSYNLIKNPHDENDGTYDLTRKIFKGEDRSFARNVSVYLAFAELINDFGLMTKSVDLLCRQQCLLLKARSCVSTVAYNYVRDGTAYTSFFLIHNLLRRLHESYTENGRELKLKCFVLRLDSPELMLERGSDKNSFEVENFEKISDGFDYAIELFNKEGIIECQNVQVETLQKPQVKRIILDKLSA